MAVSWLAWPVMMTASVSGDTCLSRSSTSMPDIPGIRKSRIAASNLPFSRILKASCPSAQTVTSCPRRGNSLRINSCNGFSSSTKRTRSDLCGGVVAKRFLLDGIHGLDGQAHAECAALVRPRTVRLDLSSVLVDDLVRDRQSQARSLSGSTARKERLEDVLQHFLSHAAARIAEEHLRHAVLLAQVDHQSATVFHAFQGV